MRTFPAKVGEPLRAARITFPLACLLLLAAQHAGAWPDLRLTKTGPAQSAPGNTITYTLTYTNTGPVKSTGVVLKDFVPVNTAALTNTLNGGSLSNNTIIWNIGTLNSKAGGSRSFQVRINTNAPAPGSITNRAQIFGKEAEETGKTNDNYATCITALTNANRVPVAQNDTYTIAEDTTLVIAAPGVLANDSDPDGNALTAILFSGPAHGTLTLNANGGFIYTPNPDYTGSDSFTYRANDGSASSGSAIVTINVTPLNDPPVAQNDIYNVTEDSILNIPSPGVLANDSDPDGDPLIAILVSAPLHGTLTLSTNGGFIYTPATNYNGPDSFSYRANDGTTNSGIATVNITVLAANDPPVAQNDDYSVAEDSTLNIAAPGILANDSDADGNALTAILVTGPAHGTLVLSSNGSFTYTPNSNYFGPDSFTYRANDGTASSAAATVTINVTPLNDPPVAQNDSYNVTEDSILDIPAPGVLGNDSDPDGDPLIAILISAPLHGTLTLSTNGGFIYTPNTNYSGPDSFSYRAHDGTTNSGIATVNITVAAVNDPPVALSDNYTVTEDSSLNITAPGVLGNDSDADGNSLTAILISGPSHGTLLLNPNGSFTYTPIPDYIGLDSFSYRANDGTTNSEIAVVTISVIPANDPPVAQNDDYNVNEDSSLNITAPGILGNDSDPDGDPLVAILFSGPAHGTLTLSTNGGFIYTPNTNYNGPDSFSYRANDGTTNSGIATVNITVIAANDPPVAQNDEYSIAEDTLLIVFTPGVLGNDSDPDGDALSTVLVTPPAHGQLTLNPNGGFTYQPFTNFNGLDSFDYRANDGQGVSGLTTVTLRVTPVNDPPGTNNWTGSHFTVLEDAILNVTAPGLLSGIVDVDGDVLSVVQVSTTTNGVLSASTNGSFTYAPEANYNGSDSFQFRVSDGTTISGVLTAGITIVPVNDEPSFTKGNNQRIQQNAGAQTVPGWATNISPGPGNESSQTVTFIVTNSNNALFAVPPTVTANGTLTYTPATNINGSATVTIRAHDNGGTANGGVDTSSPQTFGITVNAPPNVSIISPTNGASFFAPADFTLLADALDPDGTVVKVDFFSSTNKIAEAASGAPFFTVLTNLPVGTYTFGATATDDFGATGSAIPITVSVIERPPLTLLSSVRYNPQTDFFEQRVRISNPTYSTLNAVRVMVLNLTNSPAITVRNRTGFTNNVPYVQTHAVVPPGSYVDMTIEFYSPLRVQPNPVLRAELVPPNDPVAPLEGTYQRVNRGLMLANRTFLVEFPTLTNRVYSIEYSKDLIHWKTASPAITGTGNWVQWIDNGEPKTESTPANTTARFYRLILLP